jgi:UDP-N-acetyl-D-galactosamine dehydrogenase
VLVEVVDPFASSDEFEKEYGFEISSETGKNYDAIIVAVAHTDYIGLTDEYFKSLASANGIFMDVKGIYRKKIKSLTYMSL